ncbi:acetyltransferase [Castellaniella caeni]|uniref:acetyltransferase n=1 Tax=Castellaniella caeni TaxID=266123 RepID=UPI000836C1DF|nr:acetyltransferase [Castellaniella caeni]
MNNLAQVGHTLAILGASGHGKVVAEAALAAGWEAVEFYDRAWPGKQQVGRWAIIGDDVALLSALDRLDGVVVAIGNNQIRLNLLKQLHQAGVRVVSILHPMACISGSAIVGGGTVALAGAIVNADAVIGSGAILNTACSVDHDCILGEAVHISPGAHLAGDVQVGDRSWIGIGASVRQGVLIGSSVIVGAGAAVVSDIADGLTVVGVPARPMVAGYT